MLQDSDTIETVQAQSPIELSDLLEFGRYSDEPLAVTMFADVKAQRIESMRLSLRQLQARLTNTTASQKSALPLIKLATFGDVRTEKGNCLRHDANLLSISGVEGDYDASAVSPQDAAERLRQASSVLAADFGFRAAVGTGDQPTIRSALDNSGERIGAAVTVLLDPGLQLVVTSEAAEGGMAASALQQVAAELARDSRSSRIARVNRVPYQFVMVPVRAPALIGWVLMGFPVDQTTVNEMQALLSVQVPVR